MLSYTYTLFIMKVNGHGQAKILSSLEINTIFELLSLRDRTIFSICLHSGCRITEALSLHYEDISLDDRLLLIRANRTKTRKSRTIPMNKELVGILKQYLMASGIRSGNLFPPSCNVKKNDTEHMSRVAMHYILTDVCQKLGIRGASTHSFRRTALTRMSNAGVPLHVIQAISGHTTLSSLQKYLGVREQQLFSAVDAISNPNLDSGDDSGDDSFPSRFGF